jgi:formate dehydrogenase subunit gamma
MRTRRAASTVEMTDEAALLEILSRHGGRGGALLPILHDIQDAFGFVPDAAVPVIAEALNQSRAEIHGAISFYHDFRRAPAPRPVVKLCRAEACQARGADRVAAALEAMDGIVLEPVYCLGLCASGPAAMIGRQPFARLDVDAARRLARSTTA